MLTSVTSQRTQYKPYGYELDFSGDGLTEAVYVEIDVPKDSVISEGDGKVTIDLKGLNVILRTLADSIDELDRDFKQKVGMR